jgi:two-component system, NtrC family, sensor kinase
MEKNRRILLVDDNPSIHEDFRKILLGSQVRNEALDAAEAIIFGDNESS